MQKGIYLFLVAVALLNLKISAQEKKDVQTSKIDSLFTQNSDAIVRSEEVIIEINSINSIVVKTKRIVTVLNKNGVKHSDFYERYDSSTKIKKLEAIVYDANGEEIKKYKKGDFEDHSAVGSGDLATDNRVKYIQHTPLKYPYTLAFESEVQSTTTAFVEPWFPVSSYRVSVVNSSYEIVNPNNITLRFKERNLEGYSINHDKTDTGVVYSISNLEARLPEVYSPSFLEIVPSVWVALNDFSLEGVKGSAVDWKSFGKWQYDNLLLGRGKLSDTTVKQIEELVSNAKTNKEKAKLIYEYVQKKTRYISVQLGIGGWMPFLAEDVDRLGYGDCKALTNYTKALLDSQNITSYYTIVYGDRDKRNIDAEFVSMQGNHVILNIPDVEDEDIWLECTSQTMPFNFIGDFTDDRNVLVITPEGGKIKKTKKYLPEENIQHTVATVNLNKNGSMLADIERTSKGLEYDWNYNVQYETPKNQRVHYKKHWGYINGLEVKEIKLKDDKETISFIENIKVSCSTYSKKIGNRLLVCFNLFDRDKSSLPKYEERSTSFVIPSGYINTDEYVINLPEGFGIADLPEKKSIESIFGEYMYELEKINENQIKFRRYVKIIDGIFPKEQYEDYRKFRSKIQKIDKSRIALKQQ